MDILKSRKRTLAVLLSLITAGPMANLNAMERVANMIKFAPACIGLTALKLLKGSLVLAPYTKGIKSLAGSAISQIMLRNDNGIKSLDEAMQHPFLAPIALRILDITKQLELNPGAIRVCMSTVLSGTGVQQTLKGPLLNLNYYDLSDMDDEQRISVIGHELAHIKDYAYAKILCASWAIPLAFDLACFAINLCIKKNYPIQSSCARLTNLALAGVRIPAVLLAVRSVERYYEKHADIVSAKVGHCTQKAIQFFQKLKNEVAASTENSLFSRLKLAFFEFFDGHPPMTERIKYLEPIAQEQAAH